MKIDSPAFRENEAIPRQYTCDGENLSPALSWSGVPEEAKSLALIMDDPDAPARTFVHWVIYDLPASLAGLPEGVPKAEAPAGASRKQVDAAMKGKLVASAELTGKYGR